MTLEIIAFERKSFPVDAVRVTEDNMREVAEWCNGSVRCIPDDPDNPTDNPNHVKVRVLYPLSERQTKAYVGDWVLYAGKSYKVYNDAGMKRSFNVSDKGNSTNVFDSNDSALVSQANTTPKNPGGTAS